MQKKKKKKRSINGLDPTMSGPVNFNVADWEPLTAATIMDYRRVFLDPTLRERGFHQLRRRLKHVRAHPACLVVAGELEITLATLRFLCNNREWLPHPANRENARRTVAYGLTFEEI